MRDPACTWGFFWQSSSARRNQPGNTSRPDGRHRGRIRERLDAVVARRECVLGQAAPFRSSETKFQCELSYTGRYRGTRDFAECGHAVAECGIRIPELRAVEGVEEFGPELESHPLG